MSATPFMSEANRRGHVQNLFLSIPKRGKVRVRVGFPVTQLVMNLPVSKAREMQG